VRVRVRARVRARARCRHVGHLESVDAARGRMAHELHAAEAAGAEGPHKRELVERRRRRPDEGRARAGERAGDGGRGGDGGSGGGLA
jgi:hypothetical protein